MLIMKLGWDANLSAFSLWVVNGILIASIDWKINPILKGIIISFMVLLPISIIIGSRNILDLIPILTMTLFLGRSLGYLVGRMEKG